MTKKASSVKSVSKTESENIVKKSPPSTKKVEKSPPKPVAPPAPQPEKKTRAKKKAVEPEPVQPQVVAPVEVKEVKEVKAEKKTRVKKIAEPVQPQVAETVGQEPVTEKKKRREVRLETLEADFDALVNSINNHIDTTRASGDKKPNFKFLRQVCKTLKVLKSDAAKVSKQKHRKTTRQKNMSSGFMKPVKVSNEMASFANWDPTELKSRIDATKYICSYIKEHNLQNPNDKRQILPDDNLRKLLKYDSSSDKPLTYYSIQQKIQPHFNS